MDGPVTALTIATAVGCGLNGGVFFAFSSFVMPALARLRPAEGTAAMQSINLTAVTPAFMTVLFGTGALCVAVIVAGLAGLGESYGRWLVAGGVLYLAGTIVLTMLYHVPRNDALAAVDTATRDAASLWERYLSEWTGGNHVRAVAGAAAAALLVIGIDAG
jgi:uncharacterized membrane protein